MYNFRNIKLKADFLENSYTYVKSRGSLYRSPYIQDVFEIGKKIIFFQPKLQYICSETNATVM